MSEDGDRTWRDRRRRAVDAHAAALADRRAAETAEARILIADFVRDAGRRGIAPAPLHARVHSGRTRYRTGLRGWLLDPAGTLAIGTDGGFYLLSVPRSWRAWLRGVSLTPHDPRLVIGEGGRDGESIPLRVVLRHVLDQHDLDPGDLRSE